MLYLFILIGPENKLEIWGILVTSVGTKMRLGGMFEMARNLK